MPPDSDTLHSELRVHHHVPTYHVREPKAFPHHVVGNMYRDNICTHSTQSFYNHPITLKFVLCIRYEMFWIH